jgi:DNA-binding transcriptional regulator YhcF (GntR family)
MKINHSYLTTQSDIFDSGLVATIGAPAFTIWNAIKAHADYNTGQAFPGLRRLAEITGMGKSTAQRAVETLEKNHLLRIVRQANARAHRGQTYIARERIEVKAGEALVCTIVMDYVPSKIKKTLLALKDGISKEDKINTSLVEILPGDGFVFDSASGRFASEIPHSEIAPPAKPVKDNQRRARAALDDLKKPVDN